MKLETKKPIHVQEIERIIRLPIEFPPDLIASEQFTRENVLAPRFREGFRFFDPQVYAISSWQKYGGLFAPIPVGWGKTLICIIIASKAYEKDHDKILLLIPPSVYAQFFRRDVPWARTRVPVTVPLHGMGFKSRAQRLSIARSGRRGCYVLPYSCLGTTDARELLEKINPTLIIADEAHYLKNPKAARTKRLFAYIHKNQPKGVCLSGTITSKSIRDYHHLIRWTLGKLSPLPHSTITAGEWSAVIDSGATPSDTITGPIVPLVLWASSNFPKETIPWGVMGFRKAYKLRLNHCPGVVVSSDAEIGTSLLIENRPSKYIPSKELTDLIERVEKDWETPNGDPIDHAIHTWKWLYELNHGFWHKLTWPSIEEYAKRKRFSKHRAEADLLRAKQHHLFHCEYLALLRQFLHRTNRPGLDTPMLVGQNMHSHGGKYVPSELFEAWKAAKELEFPGMPERDSTPILVDNFKLKQCLDWAREGKLTGKIIWVYHQAIGEWMTEILRKERIPVIYCPAGKEHNAVIVSTEHKNKVCVASITAHGTGKNLQHWTQPYLLQWPRPAPTAEQVIGRTHRQGQVEDEIVVRTNLTTEWDSLNCAATLNDALYIAQSTGTRQKVVYCNYDPMPTIVPTDFLKERGFRPKPLSKEDQKKLKEQFTTAE